MTEEWRPVVGYEGLYEVSNLGRVRSLPRWRSHQQKLVLRCSSNNSGYQQVHLSTHNKQKSMTVHRLVAQAFIPNPENKPEINHIDGDKTNNKIDNLEWVNRKENVHHAIYKLDHKTNWCRVRCVETDIIYSSCTEAARINNLSRKHIERVSDHARGNHTAGGRHWEWVDKKPNPTKYKTRKYKSNGRPRKQPTYKVKIKCKETGEIYSSILDAAKDTGIAQCNISRASMKSHLTAGGYHWIRLENTKWC